MAIFNFKYQKYFGITYPDDCRYSLWKRVGQLLIHFLYLMQQLLHAEPWLVVMTGDGPEFGVTDLSTPRRHVQASFEQQKPQWPSFTKRMFQPKLGIHRYGM